MSDIEETKKQELEEIKSPTKNLNRNQYGDLTRREKLEMVISSKTFTVVASICTLGLYYAYYLFCLEQEQDSVFVPKEDKERTFPYDRPLEADPTFREAKEIDGELCRLASCEESKRSFKQASKDAFKKIKLFCEVSSSYVLGWLEKIALLISKQDLKVESIENLRDKPEDYKVEEESTAYINKRIEELAKDSDIELDLANSLALSLSSQRIKPRRDHYLTFVFYATYTILSLITLGLFPIYHLCIKHRWHDFKNIRNHREHAYLREFDNVTDKLLGIDGDIEYSYLLLSRNRLPLNMNFFSDVFRTKIFKSHTIRRRIVTFLMVITLGMFGLFVLSKNVFDDNRLNISIDDARPTDYSSITDKKERFKLFILDLFRDIGIASKIAAGRISTINRSIHSLFEKQDKKDTWTVKFVKLLSSELYFWLFAFVFVFSTLTAVCLYMSWYPNFYDYLFFWAVIFGFGCFLVLFTRHVNLLFT